MIYYKDLENKVFEIPESDGIEDFIVISGYVGVEPIKQLEKLPENVRVTVIYGMYGSDGITVPLHDALKNVAAKLNNVEILYSTIPVHSKIYFWKCGEDIKHALIGSANFSVNGLKNDYKEILADLDENSFENFNSYYEYVRARSIPCTDKTIVVKPIKKLPRNSKKTQPFVELGICRASFLTKKGVIPTGSGLNWGFAKAHNAPNVAYIPIRAEYIKSFPHLFPPKKYTNDNDSTSKEHKYRDNDEIELIWDDGTVMRGLLEGNGSRVGDVIYPKQLSSSPKKSILGIYLRGRIGVGINKIVTKSDLIKYGRTHIDISLIGEGVYYMDFSVNKK